MTASTYAEYGLTQADAMRKLTFDMNLSLDGYIAALGDDLGRSVRGDELFQWWSDRVGGDGPGAVRRACTTPRCTGGPPHRCACSL